LSGKFGAHMRLPSSRELATDLGISRNTVVSAYDALLAEGYLESARGSGTRVAALPRPPVRTGARRRPARLPPLSARGKLITATPRDRMIPGEPGFHPGYPEIPTFPFDVWSRLVAANMRSAGDELFGYHFVAGHPRLRAALAEYLRVSRGVHCTAEQVIVVTGAQAALDLIGRNFMDPGDYFWIEDPGYTGAHNAFVSAGGRPVPLRVGLDGWDIAAPKLAPRIVFVTPSCQWPLGLVMPMEERLKLLQIAAKHDAWIVEDDYDSEYRFRGHPVPAMQGIDASGRVIYVGTMSKTMFPSLRIGYVVVPPALVDGFERAVNNTGQYPPLPLQAALADFISRGFFAAHLRRMRRLYARRQSEFLALCRERLGRWMDVTEADTGMQLVGRFTRPLDDGAVMSAALRRGIDCLRLSVHYRYTPAEQGLLLGYAGVDHDGMRHGVERLRLAFRDIENRS
jgi:GntR family transcriptional regulator/MocR family aminotransferase